MNSGTDDKKPDLSKPEYPKLRYFMVLRCFSFTNIVISCAPTARIRFHANIVNFKLTRKRKSVSYNVVKLAVDHVQNMANAFAYIDDDEKHVVGPPGFEPGTRRL
jgi:hypothetical protein